MILENIKKTLPLFVLRTAIGWLFLHEGLYKLITPGWTAQYYLAESDGPLQGLFQWIISSDLLTTAANYGVVILLILSGLMLLTGFMERIASLIGMVLLVFFYLAYPPFSESSSMMAEGNYLLVDKNFIMFWALWVIWQFRPGVRLGLDRLLVRPNSEEK